ncbi:extracellular solute-binding protein [Arthrobacter sp. zg-Y179]|uniref:extracellular solute-binding protein n=1 Tax=Arthrobacter sp. zg-Y179 TaxID=2894188 RepID=UPI001E50A518|nr:extracellular solute-binding protein [Arthrobacter sp. zg-Y179]MCC9175547.1 extracellular solute-binding protein [Arthrobacter sp. zg-Y179]
MKSKLRTGLAAMAAVGALTVSSCGFGGSGDSGEEGGATTLDLLVPSYSDGTKALWEGVIEDFESANEDISVNLQVESWENLESVLQTKIQAGEAPDIYNGGAFSAFADEGLLYPANEVASEDTISDFQESFAENETFDGTQYGLPLIASVRALFYNQDLFDAAGIQAPPTTWDELHAAAQKISATGVPGYGMPLGSEEAQGESLIWFAGNGGGFGDESEIAVNTPENLEAAEFMKKMISDGATQPDPGATQRTPMINVFAQGQIGMVYALPQTVGQIEEENPDLNYGIANVPTNSGEPSTLGVADRLMAFKNDEDKQEAIKAFMDFFYAEDNYVEWVETEGFLPTTKSGSEAMGSEESLKPFLDMLPTAKFYPTTNPDWNATDGAFKALMGQLEDQDAQTVLEQIQAKADAA